MRAHALPSRVAGAVGGADVTSDTAASMFADDDAGEDCKSDAWFCSLDPESAEIGTASKKVQAYRDCIVKLYEQRIQLHWAR